MKSSSQAPPQGSLMPAEESRLEEVPHLLIGETGAESPAHERADRRRGDPPAGTTAGVHPCLRSAPDTFFAYAATPD